MEIDTIREQARALQTELSPPREDWRAEVDKIYQAIKVVTLWQKKLYRAFGRPSVYIGYRYSDGDEEFLEYAPGDVIGCNPAKAKVRFNHATVLQFETVTEEKDARLVTYSAQLNVDDQAFLNDLLPTTVQRHDPVYPLLKIEVRVPNSQIVSESLRTLNSRIEQASSLSNRIRSCLRRNYGAPAGPLLGALGGYIVGGAVSELLFTDSWGMTRYLNGYMTSEVGAVIGAILTSIIVYLDYRAY